MKNREANGLTRDEQCAGAWLITWEWMGNHTKRKKKVVSVQNARKSIDRICDYIEQLYIDLQYSDYDKLRYAKPGLWKTNPYPARIMKDMKSVICGHNPHLYGRKVKNLKAKPCSKDKDCLTWKEIRI